MPFDTPPPAEPEEEDALTVLLFLRDAWDGRVVLAGRSGQAAFASFARMIGRDPRALAATLEGVT